MNSSNTSNRWSVGRKVTNISQPNSRFAIKFINQSVDNFGDEFAKILDELTLISLYDKYNFEEMINEMCPCCNLPLPKQTRRKR